MHSKWEENFQIFNSTIIIINEQIYVFTIYSCGISPTDGWTTEDLVFKWEEKEPVQVTVLHLPRFTLEDHTPGSCDSKTNTGQ